MKLTYTVEKEQDQSLQKMLCRANKEAIVSDRERLSLDLKASKATIRKDHAEIKSLKESLNRAKKAIKMALSSGMNHADDPLNAIKMIQNALETYE